MNPLANAIKEVNDAYAHMRYLELKTTFTGVFIVRWMDDNEHGSEFETTTSFKDARQRFMKRWEAGHKEVWLEADFTTGSEWVHHYYYQDNGSPMWATRVLNKALFDEWTTEYGRVASMTVYFDDDPNEDSSF